MRIYMQNEDELFLVNNESPQPGKVLVRVKKGVMYVSIGSSNSTLNPAENWKHYRLDGGKVVEVDEKKIPRPTR